MFRRPAATTSMPDEVLKAQERSLCKHEIYYSKEFLKVSGRRMTSYIMPYNQIALAHEHLHYCNRTETHCLMIFLVLTLTTIAGRVAARIGLQCCQSLPRKRLASRFRQGLLSQLSMEVYQLTYSTQSSKQSSSHGFNVSA